MIYNVTKEKMDISDYGRNIYKLIEYCKGIEDKAMRTQVAEGIVTLMSQVNPQVREQSNYRKKLWSHLMMMSHWELDVEVPFDLKRPEMKEEEKKPLRYNNNAIKYRHYGNCMDKMVKAVSKMEEGVERTVLTENLAHTMKRSYLTWNRNSVDDELIISQMKEMSEGRLQPSDNFEFAKEYVIEKAEAPLHVKKKKKKK